MRIHTYTCIHHHDTYTYIDLGTIYIHAYTCIYLHIHHIQTYTDTIKSLSGGVFLRWGSRRPLAFGWTPTYQTCCDRPCNWILVRGSCIEDLREEREGSSSDPGHVQRGGVRQLGSAQAGQRAEKSGGSDVQGCPECGPPTATPRDCV